MMRRLRLDIAYDGTDFSGWARMPERRSVQGELEHWISTVLRLDGPLALTCAGRTDAGVHARGQVAHVDLDPQLRADLPDWLFGRLRRVLPADVVVHQVSHAPPGFDARFSAIWRRYCYRVADAGTALDPLLRRQLTMVSSELDVSAINQAATELIGLRDFAAFCKRRDRATTIRTLTECTAVRRQDGVIEFWLQADAFCHSMVRSVVGALVAVGSGKRDQAWLAAEAASGVRSSAIGVLPPTGLVLEQVGYPPDEELAARARQSRAVRELP